METHVPVIRLSVKNGIIGALAGAGLVLPLGLATGNSGAGLPLWAMLGAIAAGALLGGVRTERQPDYKAYAFALLPALLIMLPLLTGGNYYVFDALTLIFITAIAATGLNFTVGMAGLLNTGGVGLFAAGAYAYALAAQYAGIGFWTGMPIAVLAGGLIGTLYAVPVLRLRGDYLAIVTLGFAEILRIVLLNADSVTGGAAGITGIPGIDFFGLAVFAPFERNGKMPFAELIGVPFSVAHKKIFFFITVVSLWWLCVALAEKVRCSPLGRRMSAMAEDPVACDALGIDRRVIMIKTFAISGAVTGLAGGLFAARQGFVNPGGFTFNESVLFLIIVVAGGMNPLGILPAAALAVGLPEIFRPLAAWRMPIFGLALVLAVIMRPEGVTRGRRRPSQRFAGTEAAA